MKAAQNDLLSDVKMSLLGLSPNCPLSIKVFYDLKHGIFTDNVKPIHVTGIVLQRSMRQFNTISAYLTRRNSGLKPTVFSVVQTLL